MPRCSFAGGQIGSWRVESFGARIGIKLSSLQSVTVSISNGKQYHGIAIGRRIHVIGNSCSGKSILGARLAADLGVPFVELDALNWEPDWVGLNDSDPGEFERRIRAATDGDGWVVAGSYTNFSQRVFWPRLETVVWLDLPLPQLIWRMLIRSWRRWRSKELLWGTNYERFWPQLMVWRKEKSLLWWIITQHRRKRHSMLAYSTDFRWRHIRFVRLRSSAAVKEFLAAVAEKPRFMRCDE